MHFPKSLEGNEQLLCALFLENKLCCYSFLYRTSLDDLKLQISGLHNILLGAVRIDKIFLATFKAKFWFNNKSL